MTQTMYQVDAFADRVFHGNPAAVYPLERWLPEATMQAIAAEHNLSETAFFVAAGDDYELRWFTPTIEDALCGHATLAAGFIVLTQLAPARSQVRFLTHSGPLVVARHGDRFTLDLPALPPHPTVMPDRCRSALGQQPQQVMAAVKYLLLYRDAAEVLALQPDMAELSTIDRDGVIATAPGLDCDFVSRYFAPHAGIPEDPVTGSAHCTLVPYWAKRLGKTTLHARQLSPRRGELFCELRDDRVVLAGHAVLYLEARVHLTAEQRL